MYISFILLNRYPHLSILCAKSMEFTSCLYMQATSMGYPVEPKPAIKPRHCSTPSTNDTSESLKPSIKPRNFSTPPGTRTQDPSPQHHSLPVGAVSKPSQPTFGEALQSGKYQIIWTKCADLPAPMYAASVAVDGLNIYVAAGCAPDDLTYQQIFC